MGQLGTSHHSIIQEEIISSTSANKTIEMVHDHANADFDFMREKLAAIEWETRQQNLNAEESWQLFKKITSDANDECIPKKLRRNGSQPLWMQRNVPMIIRKKRRLWKQYTTTKDYQSYLAYKRLQNEANSTVKKAKKTFEKKLAAN